MLTVYKYGDGATFKIAQIAYLTAVICHNGSSTQVCH